MWSLVAISSADYANKRATQSQYAASVCLLLQIELVAMGTLSCLAAAATPQDSETSKTLLSILQLASHQKQELVSEMSILFRVRHQLLIMYDAVYTTIYPTRALIQLIADTTAKDCTERVSALP